MLILKIVGGGGVDVKDMPAIRGNATWDHGYTHELAASAPRVLGVDVCAQ